MDKKRVVWSEGMFISPQHFQQQERYLTRYSRHRDELFEPKRWGLSALDFDTSLTHIGKVGVEFAEGIFPDGTPFVLENGLALEIPEDTNDKLVYLALPIYRTGVVDVGDASESRRYKLTEGNIFDTSRDHADPLQIELAEPNITLKLQGEELKNYTVIPIAHIVEHKSDGVQLNRSFIPSCLYFCVSSYLNDALNDLYTQVQYRAGTVSQRLQAESSSKSYQALIRDYLWMQSLGRWMMQLKYWLDTKTISPQCIFQQLLAMAGEMHGLDGKMPKDYPSWDEKRLFSVFSVLFSDMRIMLRDLQLEAVTLLKWDDGLYEKRRLLRTKVPDRKMYQSSRFILCVRSNIGVSEISRQFPLLAKLAGNSQIAELVRNALSGVNMRFLSVPPSEIKAKPNTAYFELDTESSHWKDLVLRDEAIALHIDNQLEDVEVELYLIR